MQKKKNLAIMFVVELDHHEFRVYLLLQEVLHLVKMAGAAIIEAGATGDLNKLKGEAFFFLLFHRSN